MNVESILIKKKNCYVFLVTKLRLSWNNHVYYNDFIDYDVINTAMKRLMDCAILTHHILYCDRKTLCMKLWYIWKQYILHFIDENIKYFYILFMPCSLFSYPEFVKIAVIIELYCIIDNIKIMAWIQIFLQIYKIIASALKVPIVALCHNFLHTECWFHIFPLLSNVVHLFMIIFKISRLLIYFRITSTDWTKWRGGLTSRTSTVGTHIRTIINYNI